MILLTTIEVATFIITPVFGGGIVGLDFDNIRLSLNEDKTTFNIDYTEYSYLDHDYILDTITYENYNATITIPEPLQENTTIFFKIFISNFTYQITNTYCNYYYDYHFLIGLDIGNTYNEYSYYGYNNCYREISYNSNAAGQFGYTRILSQIIIFDSYIQFENGYNSGYIDGYNSGEIDGYNKAMEFGESIGAMLTGIFEGIGAFLAVEFVPGVSFGLLALIPIVFGVVAFIMNFWR